MLPLESFHPALTLSPFSAGRDLEDPMPHPASPLRPHCGLLLISCLVAVPLFAADPIKEVGQTASDWVKTRAETVRIESAWVQDREFLTSTLGALKERAARLQDKRDHLLAVTADERAEQAALNAKVAEAREKLRETETRLQTLTGQVVQLRPMLPPRLSESLEMAYRSLAAKEASPGERMQWVMTILNRCAQFNLGITQGDEVLTLAGEPGAKSVEVIYWGLGQGYALDRAAGKAWRGAPGAASWQWEPLNGAAPAVAELMAIRHDEAAPRLVSLPAQLKAPATP
jgi:hypothetical protein